jgi:anti-sigma factor RsiW
MTPRNDSATEPLIARDATYHRAPAGLRERLEMSLAAEARAAWRPWRAMALAASFALVAVVSWNAALLQPPLDDDALVGREVVAAHVRSLMVPGHLNDVASSDQHTVKPWFNGKLDYAPPVRDFADAGFALAGGRLDYIAGRPVAALTYHHRLHTVNVFVWPANGAADAAPRRSTRDGYSIVQWVRGGMRYWAVSDIPADVLETLAKP